MRLPDLPAAGEPLTEAWGRRVIACLRAVWPRSSPSILVDVGPGGTTYQARDKSQRQFTPLELRSWRVWLRRHSESEEDDPVLQYAVSDTPLDADNPTTRAGSFILPDGTEKDVAATDWEDLPDDGVELKLELKLSKDSQTGSIEKKDDADDPAPLADPAILIMSLADIDKNGQVTYYLASNVDLQGRIIPALLENYSETDPQVLAHTDDDPPKITWITPKACGET